MPDIDMNDLATSSEDLVNQSTPLAFTPGPTADDASAKSGKTTIKDVAAENERLAADNESLKQYIATELDAIKAQLATMALQTGANAPQVKQKAGDVLDEDKPFAKIRTSSGGIHYEQGGVYFNGAGKKKEDQSGTFE